MFINFIISQQLKASPEQEKAKPTLILPGFFQKIENPELKTPTGAAIKNTCENGCNSEAQPTFVGKKGVMQLQNESIEILLMS